MNLKRAMISHKFLLIFLSLIATILLVVVLKSTENKAGPFFFYFASVPGSLYIGFFSDRIDFFQDAFSLKNQGNPDRANMILSKVVSTLGILAINGILLNYLYGKG